jgi:hypothetical protein
MVSIVTGFINNMVRNFQRQARSIQKYEPRQSGGPRPEGDAARV